MRQAIDSEIDREQATDSERGRFTRIWQSVTQTSNTTCSATSKEISLKTGCGMVGEKLQHRIQNCTHFVVGTELHLDLLKIASLWFTVRLIP